MPATAVAGVRVEVDPNTRDANAPDATLHNDDPGIAEPNTIADDPADPPQEVPPPDTPTPGATSSPETPSSDASDGVVDSWGDSVQFVTHDQRQRRYLLHTPAGWDGATALPLVVVLHGGAAYAEMQRLACGMNEESDEHQFLVAYPDGTGVVANVDGEVTPLLTWNAGGCCGWAVQRQVNDTEFLAMVIDDVAARRPVEPRRVYLTGMSNGSMMAYRAALEMPDRIAAVAGVAGALIFSPQPPPRPLPVMHVHGLLDAHAPYAGGYGQNAGSNPVFHTPVEGMIAWWAGVNGCQPTAVLSSGDGYDRVDYRPTSDSPPTVSLITIPEGGHTWPGGVDVTAHLNTGNLVEEVDASGMIWAFFAQFELPE